MNFKHATVERQSEGWKLWLSTSRTPDDPDQSTFEVSAGEVEINGVEVAACERMTLVSSAGQIDLTVTQSARIGTEKGTKARLELGRGTEGVVVSEDV